VAVDLVTVDTVSVTVDSALVTVDSALRGSIPSS